VRRALLPLLVALALPVWAAGDPLLQASTEKSDTGEYRLSWSADGAEVVLEEATAEDFADARTIFQGTDEAAVVSGRFDGVYRYRLRLGDGPWSAPVAVVVEHHSAAETFTFLGLGALVFLATGVLVVAGHRQHRREMRGAQG